MRCSSMAEPTPRPRYASAVRIDLISPCAGSSSLSAPQPSRFAPSHAVQKVISGARNADRSRACTHCGGEFPAIAARCSASRAMISLPLRSSSTIRMPKNVPHSTWRRNHRRQAASRRNSKAGLSGIDAVVVGRYVDVVMRLQEHHDIDQLLYRHVAIVDGHMGLALVRHQVCRITLCELV